MIAKTLMVRKAVVDSESRVFREICMDILSSETSRGGGRTNTKKIRKLVEELIISHCGDGARLKGSKKAVHAGEEASDMAAN